MLKAWVWFLVGELRSHKLHDMAKNPPKGQQKHPRWHEGSTFRHLGFVGWELGKRHGATIRTCGFCSSGWTLTEPRVLKLLVIIAIFLFLLAALSVFTSYVLKLLVYTFNICVLMNWCLYLGDGLLCTWKYSDMKSTLSGASVATAAFYWLVLARYIFSHPLTFNLFVASFIQWYSICP